MTLYHFSETSVLISILQLNNLLTYMDDLENRLGWKNICAIGIPESVEGKNPVKFIDNFLLSTFGDGAFSPMFSME